MYINYVSFLGEPSSPPVLPSSPPARIAQRPLAPYLNTQPPTKKRKFTHSKNSTADAWNKLLEQPNSSDLNQVPYPSFSLQGMGFSEYEIDDFFYINKEFYALSKEGFFLKATENIFSISNQNPLRCLLINKLYIALVYNENPNQVIVYSNHNDFHQGNKAICVQMPETVYKEMICLSGDDLIVCLGDGGILIHNLHTGSRDKLRNHRPLKLFSSDRESLDSYFISSRKHVVRIWKKVLFNGEYSKFFKIRLKKSVDKLVSSPLYTAVTYRENSTIEIYPTLDDFYQQKNTRIVDLSPYIKHKKINSISLIKHHLVITDRTNQAIFFIYDLQSNKVHAINTTKEIMGEFKIYAPNDATSSYFVSVKGGRFSLLWQHDTTAKYNVNYIPNPLDLTSINQVAFDRHLIYFGAKSGNVCIYNTFNSTVLFFKKISDAPIVNFIFYPQLIVIAARDKVIVLKKNGNEFVESNPRLILSESSAIEAICKSGNNRFVIVLSAQFNSNKTFLEYQICEDYEQEVIDTNEGFS